MKKSIKQKHRGMLVLPIKKKWFDMIISREKKEEYREIKPYYDSRFKKYMPRQTNFRKEKISPEFFIIFRNGYSYCNPSVICKCYLEIGTGKEKWGAIPGKKYYVLKIMEIKEFKNINKGEEEECKLLVEKDIVAKQQN